MTAWVSPWWLGLTVDHLYENCPGRVASIPELERVGWTTIGSGEVDAEGTDICGICSRWWWARRKAVK